VAGRGQYAASGVGHADAVRGHHLPVFIGVVRDGFGRYEDKFFSTVFIGSGLLFPAMMFLAAGVGAGLKTGLMPRWLVGVTYLVAVGLLLASYISMWLTLTFPIWVLVVSVLLLVRAVSHTSHWSRP
jgi:hypothetical protein